MEDVKETRIGNSDVLLSQRTVISVKATSKFVDNHSINPELTENAVIFASVISESLLQTGKNLPWYKFPKKLYYRKFRIEYLLRKLSIKQLYDKYLEVLELEGIDVKKKIQLVEPQLAST